jgi:DNA repair protein RecN (Recombination protein N)
VNERLDLIYKLQHKHSVDSISHLITLRQEFDGKLQNISSLTGEIEALTREADHLKSELAKEAGDISASRVAVFRELEEKIGSCLTRMGMPDGRIVIGHQRSEEFNRDGLDAITFLFSANKGIEPAELSKIASGGELSRFMLSVKSIISEKKLLPTIIFDEIDNGISGDIAGRVGDVMHDASASMQVIAITHLPQIAGRGNHHYIVYKESERETTVSRMRRIDDEERVVEIAKMLSGDKHTVSSRETAREFLRKPGSEN